MRGEDLRNRGGVPFLTLRGVFVVRAKQKPDGDTIAFAATAPYPRGPVRSAVPVDPTGARTVNIRLQSIDAPEKAQPFGARSRDGLLRDLGIAPRDVGLGEADFDADGPTVTVPGWLATHGLDGNRRQLGYVFATDVGLRHGATVNAEALLDVLKHSVNHRLVRRGLAYPAFYGNTDELHADVFRRAAEAEAGRATPRGIWAADATTTGFEPTPDALGADGALVYPKFFRRVAEWKAPRADGRAFIAWLKTSPGGQKLVEGAERDPVPLWALFEPVGRRQVRVPYDVSRLWWSE